MAKWQYKTTPELQRVEEMNALGKEGWELIMISQTAPKAYPKHPNDAVMVWKRPYTGRLLTK